MQQWQTIQRQDMPPFVSKTTGTSKSSSTRGNRNVHIWKEKGNHLPLWDKVKIIDRKGHWKRRCLKEMAHVGPS